MVINSDSKEAADRFHGLLLTESDPMPFTCFNENCDVLICGNCCEKVLPKDGCSVFQVHALQDGRLEIIYVTECGPGVINCYSWKKGGAQVFVSTFLLVNLT